ncbi:MAG: hypothetical protein ACKVP5_20430, partial [Aestuariivirga sp.]
SADCTCGPDFCLFFVLHTTTMSQKSSSLQVIQSVPQDLNPDRVEYDWDRIERTATERLNFVKS